MIVVTINVLFVERQFLASCKPLILSLSKMMVPMILEMVYVCVPIII